MLDKSSNTSSEAMSKIFAFWAPRRSRQFGQSTYRDRSLRCPDGRVFVYVCGEDKSMNFSAI